MSSMGTCEGPGPQRRSRARFTPPDWSCRPATGASAPSHAGGAPPGSRPVVRLAAMSRKTPSRMRADSRGSAPGGHGCGEWPETGVLRDSSAALNEAAQAILRPPAMAADCLWYSRSHHVRSRAPRIQRLTLGSSLRGTVRVSGRGRGGRIACQDHCSITAQSAIRDRGADIPPRVSQKPGAVQYLP